MGKIIKQFSSLLDQPLLLSQFTPLEEKLLAIKYYAIIQFLIFMLLCIPPGEKIIV